MKTTNITLQSKNIIIKAISLKYKDDIFKEFTEEITKYMYPKAPEKIEETIEFIEASMKENEEGTNFQAVVLKKKTGEYLGNAGLHHIDRKTPELGIWIKKSAHGNSYGKEAIFALKKWADENLNYKFILYPVVDINLASKRIPEALGGKLHREYTEENMNGRAYRMLEYRIYSPKK